MCTTAYLIDSGDQDGPTNMALDEVLWREAAGGRAFVRVYGWNPRPTLSLGYFQRLGDVARCIAGRRDIPLVRRLTGGGAIVHDDEITLAVAAPAAAVPPTTALYESVHRAVARMLDELGICAEVGGRLNGDSPADPLCFHRADRLAVRVGGKKIFGSAQRRSTRSVLLHGSLILGVSHAAPEITGLSELIGRRVERIMVAAPLLQAVSRMLGFESRATPLGPDLLERAMRLGVKKYATRDWTELRRVE